MPIILKLVVKVSEQVFGIFVENMCVWPLGNVGRGVVSSRVHL